MVYLRMSVKNIPLLPLLLILPILSKMLLAHDNDGLNNLSSCLSAVKSMGLVSDSTDTVAFPSYQKLLGSFDLDVAQQIRGAIDYSFQPEGFRETGFYLLVDRVGNNQILDLYSSGHSFWLSDAAGLATLWPKLEGRKSLDLLRIEHFHTHPDLDQFALYLSKQDVSSILRLQKIIAATYGINVPYVENVIHTLSEAGGRSGNVTRVEITPEEVANARSAIASKHHRERLERRIKIPLPPKPYVQLQMDDDGGYILGNHQRRQAIETAIKNALNVDIRRKNFLEITIARQRRLQQLSFLYFLPHPDFNPLEAASKYYAISKALGIKGKVPNWLKMMIELHLGEILQRGSWLERPKHNQLIIYQNSKEQRITAMSSYLGKDQNGTWRALSRIDGTGDVAFAHDWDDVPLSYGDRAFFYELPSLESIEQLRDK